MEVMNRKKTHKKAKTKNPQNSTPGGRISPKHDSDNAELLKKRNRTNQPIPIGMEQGNIQFRQVTTHIE